MKYHCNTCASEQEVKKRWSNLECLLVCVVCNKANFEAMSDQRRTLEKEMQEKAREQKENA